MTRDSLEAYYNASSWNPVSRYITRQYNTYRDLLRDLKEILEMNIDDDGVHVVRSRRDEWGEWNETWKLDNNGKPYIIKETWS